MTRTTWRQWLTWACVLVAVTLLLLLVRSRLDKAHVALMYLLVVLGASAAAGRSVGLTVAGAAFVAFNYLFLPPYSTLIIADPVDWLVLVTFLITGVVAAQLLSAARDKAELALERAREVDRLASLGAETMAAASAMDALQSIAEMIRSALEARAVELYRKDGAGGLERSLVARAPGASDAASTPMTSWFGEQVGVALLLPDGTTRLDPASVVGLETATICRALRVRSQSVGILCVDFGEGRALDADRARLLDALAYYAALGVERVRLEATAARAETERKLESLRSALLASVSHDLRTPLTTIKALAHQIGASSPSTAARVIEEEADRLDALVGDLLDLSRIQADAVQLAIDVNTVDDLIGAALQRAHGALLGRSVAVSLPDDMLIARFDLSQTLRILVNLLENAAKYSPPGRAIEISAHRDGGRVRIEVSDEGPGVAESEVERIFMPFYRPANTPPDVRGTGLGLSIARGLAEAQGGELTYRSRAGGGSVFSVVLPAAEDPPLEL